MQKRLPQILWLGTDTIRPDYIVKKSLKLFEKVVVVHVYSSETLSVF